MVLNSKHLVNVAIGSKTIQISIRLLKKALKMLKLLYYFLVLIFGLNPYVGINIKTIVTKSKLIQRDRFKNIN